jgi:hypothetical protein
MVFSPEAADDAVVVVHLACAREDPLAAVVESARLPRGLQQRVVDPLERCRREVNAPIRCSRKKSAPAVLKGALRIDQVFDPSVLEEAWQACWIHRRDEACGPRILVRPCVPWCRRRG